jgi:hypothetical protein
MANGNGKSATEVPTKVFAIDAQHRTTAYTTGEIPQEAAAFDSEQELAAISAAWPATRLVEVWNRLPGVTAVSKFTDRKTAVRRIWQRLTGAKPDDALQPVAEKAAGRRTGKAKAPAKAHAPTPAAGTKTERIIALLKRPEGATLKAIMSATGWQAHSVRGFISAQLTKRMGFKVKSFKREGQRVYRIRA